MTQQQKNKFTLALTLVLFAITAILMARNEDLVFQDKGRLIVKLDPDDPETAIFYWRNDVDVPMARRFAEAYREYKDTTSRILIDLHSPGGALSEGEAVIRQINKMKRTHIVDTRVRNRRSCYSMCVPIFLQGEERYAAASARFMFHEPSVYDVYTGEKVDEPAFEKRMSSNQFFHRYFVNSEMDPDWRDKLAVEWRGKDYFVSGRQLMREGSNIVTVLE
ncbi:ATP-dependent Clp protease proteolytic subunit [Hyphococcus formosus]|uniref:ATP-dependent Clp protease proteolytic subunit n=1 Tax=Hyphococcus formosus TaxID=3143534 RepID=UPI00398AEB5F